MYKALTFEKKIVTKQHNIWARHAWLIIDHIVQIYEFDYYYTEWIHYQFAAKEVSQFLTYKHADSYMSWDEFEQYCM